MSMSRKEPKTIIIPRPVKISSELAEFTGLDENRSYYRTDVIRCICKYIRKHRLVDRNDKRVIVCDEKLGKLLNYNVATAPLRDGKPEALNYFVMKKYLGRHFITEKWRPRAKRREKTEKKTSECRTVCPGMLRLRRCFAIVPNSVDQEMKLAFLDLESHSNADISVTTECYRKQTYRHPRARQLAAACRYGWIVTPTEAYKPEEFMSRLSDATLRFEEKARNKKRSI